MNDDTTTRFIASLVKSLQSLCHGYVEFEKNIEIIGHIYLNIDSQQKYDYVVNEQVCKNEDESQAMFVSNSFHAQPARTTVRTSRQCNALDLKIQSAKDTIGIDLSTFQTDVGQGRSASRESSQSLSAGSETGSVSGNVPNREPGTSPSLHCQNPERSVSRRKRHLHDLSSKPSPDVSPPSRSRDGERRDHHDSPSLRSQYTLGASASKLARRISNELEKQGLATPAQTDNDVEIHTRLSGSNETPSRFGRNGQGASQRQFSDDSSKHIDSIKDPPEKSEGQLLADSIDLSRVKEEVIEDESLFDQLDWNRAARDADQETYDPQAEGHEASEDQIVAENLAAAASSSLYPVMIHQNTAGLPMPGYGSPVFPQNFNEPTHTMSASSSPIASTSGQLSPGAVFGARRTQPGNSGRGYTAQFTPRPGKVPQDMASKFNEHDSSVVKEEPRSSPLGMSVVMTTSNHPISELKRDQTRDLTSDTNFSNKFVSRTETVPSSTSFPFHIQHEHLGSLEEMVRHQNYRKTAPSARSFQPNVNLLARSDGSHSNSNVTVSQSVNQGDSLQNVQPCSSSEFTCTICAFSHRDEPTVHKHMRSVHFKQTYVCPICRLVFAFDKDLSHHKKQTHGNGFACEQCGKVFTLKCNLVEHVKRIHEHGVNARHFMCPVVGCLKAFTRPSHLRIHMTRNHVTDPFTQY
ncbi:uncharacterized protein [Haliotis cracherodii]|uniref:uncharacterized protein isoform X3 n=1 Tax=Haliotis cracherodii TaxID=6455 RepID=UPI0039E7C83B